MIYSFFFQYYSISNIYLYTSIMLLLSLIESQPHIFGSNTIRYILWRVYHYYVLKQSLKVSLTSSY